MYIVIFTSLDGGLARHDNLGDFIQDEFYRVYNTDTCEMNVVLGEQLNQLIRVRGRTDFLNVSPYSYFNELMINSEKLGLVLSNGYLYVAVFGGMYRCCFSGIYTITLTDDMLALEGTFDDLYMFSKHGCNFEVGVLGTYKGHAGSSLLRYIT